MRFKSAGKKVEEAYSQLFARGGGNVGVPLGGER
jgi:hypothetical protein